MSLPVNTAIQIESRNPSAAEILAYAASRRSKWFSPQRAPVKREEPVPIIVMDPPAKRVWSQHDAHVTAYLEWRGNPPLGFMKMRCRELEVRHEDIVGSSQKRIHSDPRAIIMADVKRMFPDISMPALGRLFGGRDHSTCMTCLRKQGVIAARATISQRGADMDKVKEMYAVGHTYREIAEVIGYSYTTVCEIVKERGWKREIVRGIPSHAETIRTMHNAGATTTAIAKAIGHSRDGVRCFISRMGWTQ